MSRRSTIQSLVALGLILNLVAGPALMSAQQGSTEVPGITIRANTRLVVVDVVVTDKKGQPVTGLKAEDFTLEENGKKQKISVFAAPGAPTANSQGPSAPPGILSNHPEDVGPKAGPVTVLLLDAANSPFKDQSYARSQMLRYVVDQGQSGHTMAVFTLTDQLGVLQQFTSDPQILMTAIKKFRPEEQILRAGAPIPESHGLSSPGLGPGSGGIECPRLSSRIGPGRRPGVCGSAVGLQPGAPNRNHNRGDEIAGKNSRRTTGPEERRLADIVAAI